VFSFFHPEFEREEDEFTHMVPHSEMEFFIIFYFFGFEEETHFLPGEVDYPEFGFTIVVLYSFRWDSENGIVDWVIVPFFDSSV